MKNKVFGGVLLVAGTCIGAGMLGLPVKLAPAGFLNTTIIFAITWFFMLVSALLYVEAVNSFSDEVNLISITQKLASKPIQYFMVASYVSLFYSLMAAYTSGGTSLFMNMLPKSVTNLYPFTVWMLIFLVPFVSCVVLGHNTVVKVNKFLMLGLQLSFIVLVLWILFGTKESTANDFMGTFHIKYVWAALPLIVTSFGYQALIPSLRTYMGSSQKLLPKVIMIGSLVPLVSYLLWILIIFLTVPVWGEIGLVSLLLSKGNLPDNLSKIMSVSSSITGLLIAMFSFFALTSSFIGVGMSLFDFFADFLNKKCLNKTVCGLNKNVILVILTFLVPLVFNILVKDGFLLALNYAGGFAAILLIILPCIWVWNLRYKFNHISAYKAPVNKAMIISTIMFGIAIIVIDLLEARNLMPIPPLFN